MKLFTKTVTFNSKPIRLIQISCYRNKIWRSISFVFSLNNRDLQRTNHESSFSGEILNYSVDLKNAENQPIFSNKRYLLYCQRKTLMFFLPPRYIYNVALFCVKLCILFLIYSILFFYFEINTIIF